MKSKRSKATDIPQSVRIAVHNRDGACIFCGRPGIANAHIVRRSKGGRGTEENIVEACPQCHHMMDNSDQGRRYYELAVKHIKKFYPDWTEESVTYNKWEFLKVC